MSNSLTDDITAALTPSPGMNLLITAGNALRRDDGVGPYISSHLTSASHLCIINAGFRPENIVDEAVSCNPQKIIVIDAANFGAAPGDIRLVDAHVITSHTMSTHMVPLTLVTNLIAMDTGAHTIFIGIQIIDTAYGEGLSSAVKTAADVLIRHIMEVYHA